MIIGLLAVLTISLAFVGCTSSPSYSSGVTTETFMIPALDTGIELHVRNKHPTDEERFDPERIVLFVHGATFPSETGFDIDLPGGSWMDIAAQHGFDAYCMDVRGYGHSTRPTVMEQPPETNPPFADTREAVRDIAAAVDFIRQRRGVAKINLVGWSWGTTTTASYAAQNPAQVEKLVLYAPVWLMAKAPPYQGAYRAGTRDSVRASNTRGIPQERIEEISPTEWYDKWWAANLTTDPVGASRTPPVLRSPNGVMKDFGEFWAAGKPTYDPAAIRAPTLLIVGEWDAVTPPSMAQEIFPRLTGAKYRRLVVLSEGSHPMFVEKNRMHLIREVQHFLEEPTQ
jgi:pimeloyl-ACP methyl ester carboxylesterase